ncbi:MAG: alpha-1,2-fucosyltransferase, partial [Flavobacteriales bacterium]|nr:alpha-1,2-fucosyltransferase [Flavobacteriales bacterium]
MSYVITRLMGGLGNQLFQYATGSTLASRLGVPHLLDRTFLDQRGPNVTWTPRELELDVLQAPLEFATADQVHRARRELDVRWYRLLHRALPFIRSLCMVERDRLYDPRLAERTAPVYLDGYWQNERYFASRAHDLRNRLFVPRDRPSEHNTAVLARIRSTVSASLHIRRGDYVSLESASAYHGICTLEYYSSSARHLAEHVGVERFFIFS